jgi:hypothetical protein|tara:strand:- start:498 stop:782 length:285 start_codon:yes stop_codon:yes gene_type:complete
MKRLNVVMKDCCCYHCGPGRVYTIEKDTERRIDGKYYDVFHKLKWSTCDPEDPNVRKAKTYDGVIVYLDEDYTQEVDQQTYKEFIEDVKLEERI